MPVVLLVVDFSLLHLVNRLIYHFHGSLAMAAFVWGCPFQFFPRLLQMPKGGAHMGFMLAHFSILSWTTH